MNTTINRQLCAKLMFFGLIAFGAAIGVSSSAFAANPTPTAGQTYPCQPVAYLFRHAEDEDVLDAYGNKVSALTPAGYRHAAVYPAMVQDLGRRNYFCPVSRVYSVSTKTFKNDPGTTNPFNTAKPLSLVSGLEGSDPQTSVPCVVSGENKTLVLYEYLQKAYVDKNNDSDVVRCLKADIAEKLNAGGSVAIFWTSTGMPNFTTAVFNFYTPAGKPPRSSVYIAKWEAAFNGVNPSVGSRFSAFSYTRSSNPPDPQNPGDPYLIQCFNYDYLNKNGIGPKYYCQYSASLNNANVIPEAILPLVDGKMCDTSKIEQYYDVNDVWGYCTNEENEPPVFPSP